MNITNVLIIAFVCVTIGYIAGLLISNMRSEPKPDATLPAETEKPTGPFLEVAQLVREEAGGPLLVHLETKYYRSPGELNPTQRQQMEELTLELRKWVGHAITQDPPAAPAEQASVPADAAAAVTEPVKEMSAREMARPVPPAGAAHPHIPSTAASPPAPLAASKLVPAPKAPAKSIVMQINDILQDNVAGSEYEKRGIRLIELPNRGVAVQVGMDHFQDIDSVPEPEIRSLIRAAVSEWELKAR